MFVVLSIFSVFISTCSTLPISNSLEQVAVQQLKTPSLCGLLDVQERNSLTLQHIDANVNLDQQQQTVSASLIYANEINRPVDVVFVLPVQSQAHVSRIQGQINGGQNIEGPADVSFHQTMTTVHRLSIGTVNPGDVVTISIDLVEPIGEKGQYGEIIAKLPKCLQPRLTIPDGLSHLDFIATTGFQYSMDVTYGVRMGSKMVADIKSKDSIDVTIRGASEARVIFSTSQFPADHDLEIVIRPALEQSLANILRLQSRIGYWPMSKDLISATGASVSEYAIVHGYWKDELVEQIQMAASLTGSDLGPYVSEQTAATLTAIAALRTRYQDQQQQWQSFETNALAAVELMTGTNPGSISTTLISNIAMLLQL